MREVPGSIPGCPQFQQLSTVESMTIHRVTQIMYLLARPKTGTIKLARKHRRVKGQHYREKKIKPKTLILHRKSRSGVSSAVVFAYGSRSRREKFLDQFLSIADLTRLEVELLAFYTVSQKLHLLTRSEDRTIHTARIQSLGHGEIHGDKSELKHMASKS